MNEGSAKQQIVEGIKANSNILVTVSDSPSVDELSAALGLTILLNKINKRATSIFSGAIPPAIKFLDPERTFEGTVDSLRDFIIALDKEKADHLRYKVDGDVVKIFITPYRTRLSDKDLAFSQGDYNVEMVIALGVKEQDHLDKALEAHGKILHDATVATISAGPDASSMGSIDWHDAAASSLCEMLISLSEALKNDSEPLLDESIATAFLTGIVSATDRFSNDHTSSRVMTMAAQLMAAGANQQLIAAKLQDAHEIGPGASQSGDVVVPQKDTSADDTKLKKDKKKKDDSSLRIDRGSASATKKDDTPAKDDDSASNAPQDSASSTDTPATDQPKSDTAPLSAMDAAVQQATALADPERELTAQLSAVAPAPVASSPETLQKELDQASVTTPADTTMPAMPAADDAVATPPVSDDMPGFEALDVPAPAVSDAIAARPGNSYVEPSASASFDTPVESIITGSDGTPDQYVDPFQTPLAPLPDMRDGKSVMPATSTPPPADDTTTYATPMQPPATSTMPPAFPPLPPDLPPLPPLPDMTDTNLPPLPPPPPPPIFDQPQASAPVAAQSGAIASDKLGDIFGDATAQPAAAPVAAEPPKPGQFRIPGQ